MFSWESSNGKKRETINDLSSLEAEEATLKLPFQTYNLTKFYVCVVGIRWLPSRLGRSCPNRSGSREYAGVDRAIITANVFSKTDAIINYRHQGGLNNY